MNKNNRIYRTLAAAKHAFFDEPQQQGKPATGNSSRTAAPKPGVKKTTNVLADANEITVKSLKDEYCIGCCTCYNACPTDAIAMKYDSEGFLKVSIDNEKCTKCGLCKKVCPVINTKYKNDPHPKCYAVMADDEIRRQSSSGGMFTLAAEHIIDKGGYVAGAVLTDDFNVEFDIVSSKDGLAKMRGSKYVQSNIKDTFRKIKKLLDEDNTLLFSGCPCQVAGLYNFLRKDYEKLYTLDLVCHGAPSQGVFDKYISEYYGKENLADFKFRTKKLGYNSFNQIAYLKDGTERVGNIKFDPYEKTMHSGLTLKKVCADCPFAEAPRQGDISIGDFWGIAQHKAELNDNLGTSNAVINNEKGRRLFEELKGSMKTCEEVPFDFARRHNRFGRKMRTPSGRSWYFTMAKGQSFDKAVDYSLNRRFDVGVIGLWYGRNYGSMATYYALHQVLTKVLNLSVLMIDNPLGEGKTGKVSKTHPRRIANEFYDVSLKYPIADLGKLNPHCDTFMIGSDQLWNIHLSRPYQQMYYLSFVQPPNKRIAYGTSFGIEFCGTESEKNVNAYFLNKFDHISVRDEMSERTARELFGVKDVVQVCDPTFLCPMEEYQRLIGRAENTENENYVLAYILDPNEEIGRRLNTLSAKLGKKIVILLDESPKNVEQNIANLALEKTAVEGANLEIKREVDLYEWLWYYSHADSVVTDSFHGSVFSIIFKKPFIALSNPRRGAQRFVSLLKPLELLDRLYDAPDAITEHMDLLDSLDYEKPYEELNKIRKHSFEWLKNALYSNKGFESYKIYNAYDKRLENMEDRNE